MSSTLPPSIDPRTPVVVGVGQYLHREGDPLEPADLMVEAVRRAEADTGIAGVAAQADVVAAVPTFSWRYRDPGRLVADRIGATGSRTWYVTVGGNSPQRLLNKLAVEIHEGGADLAVLCGGEAVRSKQAAKRRGEQVDWTIQGDEDEPDWHDDAPFLMAHPVEVERGILMPTQCYPLFENALWHDSGRSLEEHLRVIGEMWAGFSRVAAANPYAWRREAYTAEEITTPTAENRMVSFPYTKRMVSNPDVDMSSGLIVCSAARAAELGIPTDRWVFLHAGTDGTDRKMSERVDFVSSASIGVAGRRVLELASTEVDEVAHLDLYSCFPSAVELALRELDIPVDRQLTVYGGLSFAGGPWNNPVGHALASMVDVLREDAGSLGLVTANGGIVDKHAFGVFSTAPPEGGFRYECPQELIDARGGREVDGDHRGAAELETWTVIHQRDGSMERAICACLTPAGARTWASSEDRDLMARMEREDVTGLAVQIDADHVAHVD
jgi:acetyl-CoA C-acetyltransferase